MHAKKRYLLLLFSALTLASWYYGGFGTSRLDSLEDFIADLPDFIDLNDIQTGPGIFGLKEERIVKKSECSMERCFDFERCRKDFRVFVYPIEDNPGTSYTKLLNVLTESRYYTPDPQKACLFILSIDTLDRDRLSTEYVRSISVRLQHLPHWNNGLNHVIFNLYSGTWPNYTENNLEFDYGKAILAKASMSESQIRHGFDISIPLFHKMHPEKGGRHASLSNSVFLEKSHLLAFKGKRYVHGIGSETRNSLYHFHNGKDIIMVTTCKHGKSWKELKDERCDEDNREYEKYDYEHLLMNSTFCLVPRGRRLGSFRFLEALQAGCIPILVSNGWALPFGEVIDWKKATIQADERLLTQVPFAARSIPTSRILQLREQTQLLYEQYFSSMEKIVYSILEIIKSRLPNQGVQDFTIWNRLPGALVSLPDHIDYPENFPFGELYEAGDTFTAVIYCQLGLPLVSTSPLFKLLVNLGQSVHVSSILVVWPNDKPVPSKNRFPLLLRNVTLHILRPEEELPKASISRRFYPYQQIQTPGILSLDEDSVLTSDEIDFAFVVWRQFPDRIVGYPARSHFYDDAKSTWSYTSRWTNDYSIVLTGAAFYHRYYNTLYTEWLSPLLHKTVEQSQNCEDILMNFLVSHVTKRPPIKVSQRKQYKEQQNIGRSPWNDPDHFVQRQTCLNTFAAVFGYMPLMRSSLRLDPVLFKDPVSNKRKKYRKIELVGN